MIIVFDEQNRVFSAVEDTREFGTNVVSNFVKRNQTAVTTGAGAVVGGTVGSLAARARAKKQAEARGMKPGTPEYKAYVRKQTAIGGGIGAGAGAGVGFGADRLGKYVGKQRLIKRNNAVAKDMDAAAAQRKDLASRVARVKKNNGGKFTKEIKEDINAARTKKTELGIGKKAQFRPRPNDWMKQFRNAQKKNPKLSSAEWLKSHRYYSRNNW